MLNLDRIMYEYLLLINYTDVCKCIQDRSTK